MANLSSTGDYDHGKIVFQRRGTDDRAVTPPSDDYWLAAQLRIITLLDRSIKRVHVDMDDFSHNLLASILLFRVSENCFRAAV